MVFVVSLAIALFERGTAAFFSVIAALVCVSAFIYRIRLHLLLSNSKDFIDWQRPIYRTKFYGKLAFISICALATGFAVSSVAAIMSIGQFVQALPVIELKPLFVFCASMGFCLSAKTLIGFLVHGKNNQPQWKEISLVTFLCAICLLIVASAI
jgi:hypothetical protein